jgi:thiamine biosynthesis lipoprotein
VDLWHFSQILIVPAMTAVAELPIIPPDTHGVRRLDFRALGTHCVIQFRQRDERAALSFAAEALGWLGNFEAKFSRFRPDSIVSRVNAAAGREWVQVDTEMDRLLDIAEGLHNLTDGILDATMLPLQRVWDWKTVHEKLPEAADIKRALSLTGWRKVQRRLGAVFLPAEGMGLDFGGFGKELAVDRLAQLARSRGIKDALIDLGRDIYAMGGNGIHPFWHVGIEDARKPGTCWGGLALSDRAVSSSGDYARFFMHGGVRYGHILDPRTGWPVTNGLRSVTVISQSCLEAGVFSTAVFVLGARDGIDFASRTKGVEVCAQREDRMDTTPNFNRWQVRAA